MFGVKNDKKNIKQSDSYGNVLYFSDKEIEKIREGDWDVFSSLYFTYYADLCDFCCLYINNPDVAKDLVHDVFLKIWSGRKNWAPVKNIRSYLYISVKNNALNHIRHQNIQRKWEEKARFEGAGQADTPESLLLELELNETIRKSIDLLPVQRKKIFLLSRDHGLSYSEIAELLGISVKTVETQIRRSIKTLSELLKDYL